MIGRIDPTLGLRRGRLPLGATRLAATLAIAALIAVGGLVTSTSTILAQDPPKMKARVKGVEPSPAIPPAGDLGAPPDVGPPIPSQLPGAGATLPGPPANPPSAIDEPRPSPLGDTGVRPAAFDGDGPGLPGATAPPGGVVPAAGSNVGPGPDPFALPIDKMGLGKQRVQLSVEVQASPIINLGKESTVSLVVKNDSNADASGVSLVYQLPDGLKINSSTPAADPIPGTSLYHWPKPMLAAGSEWRVVLKVVATSTKACEHAATVTAKTGSRANTIVQEPKLKVEATSAPGRVLKGEQVTFQISVMNPGTGPARNVTVQAKLSGGLQYGGDALIEQVIDEIGPGQRYPLEELRVDTVGGGQQSCTVDVRSPDVTVVPEDHRITRNVEVTKPDLAVKLEGQLERFTGQVNEYKLTVTNPGTAPAKKVKVVASLPPQGGKLLALPQGAKFDPATRKLIWSIPQLEPLQSVEMSFNYGTSTVGLYRATAEATAPGELRASDTLSTDVTGIAVLDVQLSQTARVMDVGKTNFYDIVIKNSGTKEATRLQLRGKLTGKLKVLKHYNVEKGEFAFNPDSGEFVFPDIERLGVGQSVTLSLEVQATGSGPAGCHVTLAHAEMSEGDKVEDVISTTVTGNKSKGPAPKP
jgi:uncharacterized repeat protein (TIGR01451 family)